MTRMGILKNYDAIMNVILPTLGAERQATYSPFCPETGIVLPLWVLLSMRVMTACRWKRRSLAVIASNGRRWAMRWAVWMWIMRCPASLIDSVSGQICRILSARLWAHTALDEKGEKISKSVGNGLSVEEWLRYAPPESLSHFMFQASLQAALFDVIEKCG